MTKRKEDNNYIFCAETQYYNTKTQVFCDRMYRFIKKIIT